MKSRRRLNVVLLAFGALIVVVLLTLIGTHVQVRAAVTGVQLSINSLSLPAYFDTMLQVDPSFDGALETDVEPSYFSNISSAQVCTHPLRLSHPLIQLPSYYPDILHKYARLHRQTLDCIRARADGRDLPHTDDPAFCARPKLLVYMNQGRRSGVGDTGRGMMISLLFAIATRRLLIIPGLADSTSYFPLTAVLVPAAIDWRVSSSIRQYCLSARYGNSHYLRLIKAPNGSLLYKSADSEFFHNPVFNLIDTESTAPFQTLIGDADVVHMFPRIPHNSLYDIARLLLTVEADDYSKLANAANLNVMLTRMLFKPSKVVQTTASSIIPSTLHHSYTSVHIRTGLDTGENITRRFGHSASYLHGIANATLACVRSLSEQRHIFLASDSLALKREMIKTAADFDVQVLTSMERVIHTSTLVRLSQPNHDQQLHRLHQCKGLINAFVDVVTLSASNVLVAARSTFADLAYDLGNMSHYYFLSIGHSEDVASMACHDNVLRPH